MRDFEKALNQLLGLVRQLRYEPALETTLQHSKLVEVNLGSFLLFLLLVFGLFVLRRDKLVGGTAQGVAGLAHGLHDGMPGAHCLTLPKQLNRQTIKEVSEPIRRTDDVFEALSDLIEPSDLKFDKVEIPGHEPGIF